MESKLEYLAELRGNGNGWSWDQAKRKGKMQDMIDVQRYEWELQVEHGIANAGEASPESALWPLCQLPSTGTRKRETAPVGREIGLLARSARGGQGAMARQLQIEAQHLLQDRKAHWRTRGMAGQVVLQLFQMLELVRGRVTPSEFMSQVLGLAVARGGLVADQEIDGLGRVMWARIRFSDGSEMSVDPEGFR